MLPSKKSRIFSRVPLLVSAVSAAAALLLSGCDSGVTSVNQQASNASNKAAHVAATAGDLRPTDSLIEQLDHKTPDERRAFVTATTKPFATNPAAAKAYVERKSVVEDLKTAAGDLSAIASNADLTDNALKAVVQSQLGSITTQESKLQLAEADKKLIQLLETSIEFQVAADSVSTLGAQADVLDARAKASKSMDFPNMQPPVDDAKAAVAKAQAALDDLQAQAAAKEKDSKQIYSDTEAALQAADTLKGQAAIDAAKKAMDDRKAADQDGADFINLQPKIAQAQMDLTLAKIEQARAEAQLAAITASAKQADADAQSATDQAAILRGAAKKLLDGDGDVVGLSTKYKDFLDQAKALDADVSLATASAKSADQAATDAATSLDAWAKHILATLSPGDPLYVIANDPQNMALIKLLGASAKIQRARVELVAYYSASLEADSARAMAGVQTAAGAAPVAIPAASIADGLKDTVTSDFNQAVTMAKAAGSSVRSPANAPAKWLSLALQSVAYHGIYAASGQNHDEAINTAKSAGELNSNLNIAPLTN